MRTQGSAERGFTGSVTTATVSSRTPAVDTAWSGRERGTSPPSTDHFSSWQPGQMQTMRTFWSPHTY